MDLSFSYAVTPFQYLATLVGAGVLIAFCINAASSRERWQNLGQSWLKRIAIAVLTGLATICLVIAVWNPVQLNHPDVGSYHLAIVMDVSDSIMRRQGGWNDIVQTVQTFLESRLRPDTVPPEIYQHGTASLITFRGSTTSQTVQLNELPQALDRVVNRAGGEGTNISAGLTLAAQNIADAGGQGEVLLVTDGNQTDGDVIASAKKLAAVGVPVIILPLGSQVPQLAVDSINLPPQIEAGTAANLRLIVDNNNTSPLAAQLTVLQNPGLTPAPVNIIQPSPFAGIVSISLAPANWAANREQLTFNGLGIQFVDVLLNTVSTALPGCINGTNIVDARSAACIYQASGTAAQYHRRRLYTFVARPIHLLSIGDGTSWRAAIPPDFATILEVKPEAFTEQSLHDIDAVVINEVPATRFSGDSLSQIATAVKDGGIGLMWINGKQPDDQEEQPTMLRSYKDTPLGPLMPISTDPRPFQPKPPPRHVVIMIDSSGSMTGPPLDKAKQIADYIVTQLMRDEDTLDVITFTDDAGHLVNAEKMDEVGKQDAVRQINSIPAGGGTDPSAALGMLKDENMTNCGLFFLSDGGFEPTVASLRPDCQATAFQIGVSQVSPGSPISLIATAFGADLNFDPSSITIPYFEQKPRNKFYEKGAFLPLPMSTLNPELRDIIIPSSLTLDGSAVTYTLPGGITAAVRSRLIDPLLVYGQVGAGYVGIFTSSIPQSWMDSPDGRKAVRSWISRLVPFSARDRYGFQVEDDGLSLRLNIMVRSPDKIPQIDALSATIRVGSTSYPVTMRPVEDSPSTFEGSLAIPRKGAVQPATLILEEAGLDALPRAQQIPILIPIEGSIDAAISQETNSYGVNAALLQQVASLTRGMYNPDLGFNLFNTNSAPTIRTAYWQLLVVIGAVLYLAAIGVRQIGGR